MERSTSLIRSSDAQPGAAARHDARTIDQRFFIYQYQSGAPLSWGNVIYLGGPLNVQAHNVDGAFDTSRFDTKSADALANDIRTFNTLFSNLRGDSTNNVNLALVKNTRIHEAVRLQLRVEAFNAFNRPQFSDPNTTPTNANFGRITNQANAPRQIQMALRLLW
jgi:hypothetical protein